MKQTIILAITVLIVLNSCSNKILKTINYPITAKQRVTQDIHGHTLNDDYYWLRNIGSDSSRIKKHLKQENDYVANCMKDTDSLQQSIFNEILALTDENYEILPYKRNNFWYKAGFENDKDFPIFKRWTDANPNEIEIYFDANKWVEYFDAYKVYLESISKDNKKLLFSVDMEGNDERDMYVLDIEKQEILSDKMTKAYFATWANDNNTIFYIKDDAITNRSYQLYRHTIGQNEEQDVLLYHEKNENYSLGIGKSSDHEYIYLYSYGKDDNEVWYLNANTPLDDFKQFSKRQKDIEYSISSSNGLFYILTNENTLNRELYKVDVNNIDKSEWELIIKPPENVIITGFDNFKNYG